MKDAARVFFKDNLTGKIERLPNSSFRFSYLEAEGPGVSLTMPRSSSVFNAEELFPFFDGLIPEGWLLDLAHKNWKIAKDDRMTLLLTTCQDCIGAVHVLQDREAKAVPSPATDPKVPLDCPTSSQCLACMGPLLKDEALYHQRCALELFGQSQVPIVDVATSRIEELALQQLNQRLILTGAQRKLSLAPDRSGRYKRLTVLGPEGQYILKPPAPEWPEMVQVEHLCMRLAQLLGLSTASCGLVPLASGELAYLTRRFDRRDAEKIPMEDFCQLSRKPTSRKYSGSGEGLGKVVDEFSDLPQDDKLSLFQVLLFSFWIGNSDMHLKNFSLWKEPRSGLIRLTPGYDFLSTRLLIPEREDGEDLALPVNGKKRKLRWDDFLALGNNYRIPEKVLLRVRDQMLDEFLAVDDLIERSFLSGEKKESLRELMIERAHRLI